MDKRVIEKIRDDEQTEDIREFIELLIKLKEVQKERVKGIMIGMQLMDEKKTA